MGAGTSFGKGERMAFQSRAKADRADDARQVSSWGSETGRAWGRQPVEAEPDRFGPALEQKWEDAWRRARAADRSG